MIKSNKANLQKNNEKRIELIHIDSNANRCAWLAL